jgi:hypothetical protein
VSKNATSDQISKKDVPLNMNSGDKKTADKISVDRHVQVPSRSDGPDEGLRTIYG